MLAMAVILLVGFNGIEIDFAISKHMLREKEQRFPIRKRQRDSLIGRSPKDQKDRPGRDSRAQRQSNRQLMLRCFMFDRKVRSSMASFHPEPGITMHRVLRKPKSSTAKLNLR